MVTKTAFWTATGTPVDHYDPITEDVTCDVVVIGGGFTGLRTALDLAHAGTDVQVIEGGQIGQGASGRSGGQVNPMLPVAKPEHLRDAVGDTYFERMTAASLASADDLFELIRTENIDCEARQHGWIRAEHCASAARVARHNARLWNSFGAGFEFMDAGETRRKTGARGYLGAVMAPKGGAVQPLSLVRGLARAAARAGARIATQSRVTGMTRADGIWTVSVGAHRVRASQVVLATNGYTDGTQPGLRRTILPFTSIQIATEPLPDDVLAELLPEGHTISDTRRLIMYSRREPGGQFVFGGIGYTLPGMGRRGYSWMLQDVPRLFPALRGVTWKYRWGGQIALTQDRVPHMHEPQPGVIAGLGYNGRGVAMSHLMGREMARRTLGAPADSLVFPITPMKPYAFREIQSAGSPLALCYLRIRDQLEMGRRTGAAAGSRSIPNTDPA